MHPTKVRYQILKLVRESLVFQQSLPESSTKLNGRAKKVLIWPRNVIKHCLSGLLPEVQAEFSFCLSHQQAFTDQL